jgi:pyruvate dehydrogenase E2 component (dihydrolipoamide acetyltransferase)
VDGYLRQILAEPGTMATALHPVAILTDTPDEPFEESAAASPAAAADGHDAAAPAAVMDPVGPAARARTWAAPAAKALARRLGVSLERLAGSGPNGLIVRKEVERHAEARGSRGLAAMAGIVAASKREIPHFYASIDCDVAAAGVWRREWNAAHPEARTSWNDLFMRCAARALRDVPRLKLQFDGGRYRETSGNQVLMVAANDSGLSLVNVPDADADAHENASQAALAVSNLGMFGVKEFAAIIPPGCTAILAIGAVREIPVARAGMIGVGKVCTMTLSADHRVVDGVNAARFLERMQHHLNSL